MDFDLDHRLMAPPFVRLSRDLDSDGGGARVWDLRIGQPNVTRIPGDVLHSLEHAHIAFLRDSPGFIHAAPMGCGTGLYVITSGALEFPEVTELIAYALTELIATTEVPLRDFGSCGAVAHHDLRTAQEVARWLLRRRDSWGTAT